MANVPVYWIGQDGNAWLKPVGSTSAINEGKATAHDAHSLSTANGSSGGLQLIADPNPGNKGYNANATGSGGKGYSTGYSSGPTAQQTANARSAYNSALSVANDTIGNAQSSATKDYGNSIDDFISNYQQQQNSINRAGVQNEMSRITGRQGVYDMVGNGMHSGGLMLANRNASDSSAADEMAKAYNQVGLKGMNNVNNQYVMGNYNNQQQQDMLNSSVDTERRHMDQSKTDAVNGIVSSALQTLGALNTQAYYMQLPDRINVEQRKQQIAQDTQNQLAAFDGHLASGLAANPVTSSQQNAGTASGLLQQGYSPTNPFSYTTAAPAQFQNTGPYASDTPVFAPPKKPIGA